VSDEQPIDLDDLKRVAARVRLQLDDNWLADMVEIAHDEIARLREERLTNDEREAIQLALTLEWPHTSEQWEALAGCVGPVCKVPANKYKVAIDAFLARQPLPPGPEGDG
jgi:hypothetical protein